MQGNHRVAGVVARSRRPTGTRADRGAAPRRSRPGPRPFAGRMQVNRRTTEAVARSCRPTDGRRDWRAAPVAPAVVASDLQAECR